MKQTKCKSRLRGPSIVPWLMAMLALLLCASPVRAIDLSYQYNGNVTSGISPFHNFKDYLTDPDKGYLRVRIRFHYGTNTYAYLAPSSYTNSYSAQKYPSTSTNNVLYIGGKPVAIIESRQNATNTVYSYRIARVLAFSQYAEKVLVAGISDDADTPVPYSGSHHNGNSTSTSSYRNTTVYREYVTSSEYGYDLPLCSVPGNMVYTDFYFDDYYTNDVILYIWLTDEVVKEILDNPGGNYIEFNEYTQYTDTDGYTHSGSGRPYISTFPHVATDFYPASLNVTQSISATPGQLDFKIDKRGNNDKFRIVYDTPESYEGDWANASASSSEITTQLGVTKNAPGYTAQYYYGVGYSKYLSEFEKTLKHYYFPEALTAEQTEDGNVLVYWNIDYHGDLQYDGDQWIVQRASNAGFTDNVVTLTKDYEPLTGYSDGETVTISVVDNVIDKPNQKFYYRLRRTAADSENWGWACSVSTSIQTHTVHRNVRNPKAAMANNTTARITWDWNTDDRTVGDELIGAAWTPGSKINITRTNASLGTSITFQMPTDSIENCSYSEILPTTCDKYTYSLQVIPGNSSQYTTPDPVGVKSDQPIFSIEMGEIISVNASKGYFSDRVDIAWTADGNTVSLFSVMSRIHGSGAQFEQIDAINANVNTSYKYSDTKAVPGVIYDYRIVAMANCGDELKENPAPYDVVGFRTPTGDIYGRVTYQSGQAVEDVEVRAEPSEANAIKGKSYLFGEDGQLITEPVPLGREFSVQAWIKPTGDNGCIIAGDNFASFNLSLWDGVPRIMTEGGMDYEAYSTALAANEWHHLTAVVTPAAVTLYVDGRKAYSAAQDVREYTATEPMMIGGNMYTGLIDEVRVWNRALTPDEVLGNYNRYLVGNEEGLAAYYTFDYAVEDEFFDTSYSGTVYNERHGTVADGTVTLTEDVPTSEQLGWKNVTGADGAYTIRAIPYAGNGTSYMIVPRKGNHKFGPEKELRLLNANAQSHTVNFTDESSFPVSGRVTYAGGTIPVEGVAFYIDGKAAMDGKNNMITTAADGTFTIEVPVGVHEVQARLAYHEFEGGGYIKDIDGGDRDYQDIVTGIELTDNTTVRYIGRLTGGAREEAFPIGHSLSTNNLGDHIAVTLTYPNESYRLNNGSPVTETKTHFKPSNKSEAKTNEVVTGAQTITIYPNLETGEFVADVIPERFNVSVSAPGYDTSSLGGVLDLTQAFAEREETRAYTDSTMVAGKWQYKEYSDTVRYNEMQKFAVRVAPDIDVAQLDESGKEIEYFGERIVVLTSSGNLYLRNTKSYQDGTYYLGKPQFKQGAKYTLRSKVTEKYNYYTDTQGSAFSATDCVPVDSAIVKYTCHPESSTPAEVEADADGVAEHTFQAGFPDLTTATSSIEISAKVGDKGPWFDYTNPALQHFWHTGTVPGNSNFVTAGPDMMLTVLRDPPGSKSYSYMEEGTTITQRTTYEGSAALEGEASAGFGTHTETYTFVGLGGGVSTHTQEVEFGSSLGVVHEFKGVWGNERETTTTFTTNFQTSDDPLYVGPEADVYVGYSTNITYGTATSITLVTESRYQEAGSNRYTIIHDFGAGKPKLCKHEAVNMDQSFNTLFAYPQVYIEGQLIPNLIDVRNSMIVSNTIPRADAVNTANAKKSPVYLSKLPDDDPNWGKSNTDPVFDGKRAGTTALNGPSYEIVLPTYGDYRLNEDSVQYINQSIAAWQKVIADNEKAKLTAEKLQNYSFQAGAGIEYSEEMEVGETSKSGFEITAGLHYNTTGMTEIFCIGIAYEVDEKLSTTNGETYENGQAKSVKKGFVLAEEGDDDYISVDVMREKHDPMSQLITGEGPKYGNFVFRTKAGATSCPYEGGYTTRYYNPGTMIDAATVQIEKPRLSMENTSVRNVPSGEPAYLTMYLRNESELNQDCYFDLRIVDQTNPDGLGLYIDGAPIGNGRTIFVPAGQTTIKTLECRKASALSYDNVQLALVSQCQSDPSTFMAVIGDTCTFSVGFTPSATAVNIKKPGNNWTYNTKLPTIDVPGKTEPQHYMDVVIDGINVNYDNFHSVELQYKTSAQSDDQWTTLMAYYADSDLYDAAVARNEQAELIDADAQGTLGYRWMLDAEPDQMYDLRAVGVSMVNNQRILRESDVRSGIKDMYTPRLFGQPQPADGILGPADEIRINFNEPIASGYLTENNFQVTGIRNGARTDHSVSVEFDGSNDLLTSEAVRNLAGKDVTVEMWVNAPAAAAATWFNHGGTDGLSFGITADSKLQVKVGETTVTSPNAVDFNANQWAHVAMVYDCSGATPKVSAFYNFVEAIHAVDAPAYAKTGSYAFGGNLDGGGNFAGKMHGARIWSKPLRGVELQANSLSKLSGRELNLMACYPMDEGRGSRIADKAHSASLAMNGCLWAMPEGKAAKFNGSSTKLSLSTGASPIDSQMDYTLEFWMKGDASNSNATLMGNGLGDGTDAGATGEGNSLNVFSLGFENGLLALRNNAQLVLGRADILDDNWHHVAVAVSRTLGYGQLIVDGEVDTYFPIDNIGGIAGDAITVGARSYTPIAAGGHMGDAVTDRYFNGTIDEIRLWNTYRSESIVKDGNNSALEGTEMGLLAYYPFEAYATNQGTQQLVFSLADAKVQPATGTPVPDAVATGSLQTAACAPVKGAGEISKLFYDFVANDDAVIITLKESLNRIENTVVTFTVDGIRDLNGNEMANPVTWTAYIDRNQLGWSEDAVNIDLLAGETAQFSVDVVNSGGTSVDYRIENVPAWLSVSRTSGKIGPDSRQSVDFTVTDMANIGRYAEQIYLIGNNDVTETLELNVTIMGERPDWEVNPADFAHNMSIFGRLMINGQYSRNTADVLAAFEGAKCVGVARTTYVEEKDSYYTLLTVYSNDPQGKAPLQFNIWDASTGQIYVASAPSAISFAANAVLGSPDQPLTFTTTNDGIQNIDLKAGWTWLSINVEDPRLGDLNDALGDCEWHDGDALKEESTNTAYTYGRGKWILGGGTGILSTSTMYKIMSAVPQTAKFTGPIVPPTTPITILGMSGSTKRWSYLPYYPQYRMSVNEAFSNYEAASGDIVKSQTGFASYSDNLGWVGSLKVLEPGQGYMLQRAAAGDATMSYPSVSVIAPAPMRSRAEEAFSEVNADYVQNMTMTVAVDGFEVEPGDIIVATPGLERRGASAVEMLDNGALVCFLTVSGADDTMLDISIERDGRTVATAESAATYINNANAGTPEHPMVIDFRQDLGASVFPRLTRDNVTIRVNADKGSMVDIVIHDSKGARVALYHDCAAEAARGIVWNAASLVNGMYLIDVVVDGKVTPFKVVKE